jgi:hypothetical protein
MKSKSKAVSSNKDCLKQIIAQTRVISGICRLALAEERQTGKASAKTHRDALKAADKLKNLIKACPDLD